MNEKRFRDAFRRLARNEVTLLRPSGRQGKLQATAKVVYEPVCQITGAWSKRKRLFDSGEGGKRQGFTRIFKFLPEAIGNEKLTLSHRIVRGHYTAPGTWDELSEWQIDDFGPGTEFEGVEILTLELSQPKRGA